MKRTCGCHSHNGFVLSSTPELAQLFAEDVLDGESEVAYLDRVVSVSALVEVEGSYVFDHELIDQQHRRFLNGS